LTTPGRKNVQIRRILVPIDGSELSLRAAETAAELAHGLAASVTLFTVVDPPEAAAAYVNETTMEEIRRGLWQTAEAMLGQAAARIRSQHPQVERRTVWGSPVGEIAAEAKAGYDLIVMGSRGLGLEPVDRPMLGSVTERILRRAHCPVLVVPGYEAK
jgi:nucleotide-binding universal stress UspA family protein